MPSNFDRYLFIKIRRSLPPHLRSSKDFYFLTFSITSLVGLLFVIVVLAFTQQILLADASIFCAAMLSLTLTLWRLGISLTWVQFLFQLSVVGGICFGAYFTGGLSSPVMMWMGIVPILPLFTVSRRWSYVWLFFSFTCVFFLYWAQLRGFVTEQNPFSDQALTLGATMIVMLCITQVIIFMLYESANAQSIRQINRKNQALNNLSHDLQMANVHKARFLSTVSHEIRTPLNAVMGYLGLLRKTPQHVPDTAAYLEGAEKSASHLLTVINDLLDYSQIQQGKLALNYQTVDLRQLLSEAFQSFAPKASKLDIHYALHLDPALPIWAYTDPHRLAQIFTNLLDNALKFTASGSVIAHVLHKHDPQPAATHTLWIKVHDSGIGIPEKSIRRIFEPFIQLDTPPTLGNDNGLRGNGLGLTITRHLVQNLGGFMHLSSQEGVGSCFEVQLPINFRTPEDSSELMVLDPSQQKHIHLLIVDDHATNRLVASATIKQDLPYARIDEARNGTQAVAMMKACCYDLVLMDLLMPDLSGIEVVKRIRTECAAPHRDVKVVALTADVSDRAVHQCKEIGIEVLIPKPFDRAMLIQTVLQQTA